ncbi:transmembrane protein, putative (macronuclear) [Tetrahymena thermophila SB210]|uniref:Transmembrane protein, putative n=1 Tax=Tetrahymena thermophila (strain SB210) TaxID=312017 RepID=Q23R55_TETTS|nr:transmembrane protein, putative [Tetrahymena thermophila SB210]EAR98986.2 transmembrane protein, putative [Tetrahymena thermophila SB210]|eukprot:XP_001019231.2 transmembrane protein, putative [Tetrahymena thermophila SB210]
MLSFKQIIQRILQAYSEVSSSIYDNIQRPLWLCYILQILKYYYLIQMNFTSEIGNQAGSFQSIQNLILFKSIKNSIPRDIVLNILYFVLALNILTIGYIIIKLFLILFEFSKNFKISVIDYFLSFYCYALAYPSLYLSFICIQQINYIALMNAFLTLLIGLFGVCGDYSYKFFTKDYLQKRNSNLLLLAYILEIIGIVIYSYSDSDIIIKLFFIAQSLFKTYLHLFTQPYYSQPIMMLTLQGAIIRLSISSIILLQNYIKLQNKSFVLANFFVIPLGFVIGRVLLRIRINYLLENCYEQSSRLLQYQQPNKKKSFSFINVDIYCRYIINNYQLFFSEYSLSKYSIQLEQLITDHITKCESSQDCVCSDIQKTQKRMDETGDIQRETFLGNQQRKSLLNQHLNLVYLNLIRQSNSKSFIANVYFSYFSFLGDILQNQNTLFIEIQKFCSSSLLKQMNIIDQTRLKLFVENLYNKYQQKINAQQTYTNYESNSIYSIISYDEKLQNAEKQFTLCIQKKKKLVQLLCQQEFSLKDLQQNLQDLFDSREYLGNLLENLVEFKCYSTYLRCLCESFQSTFKSNSKLIKQIRTVKKITAYSSKIPFYSENSCVAFLSLLENQVGQITSISKNFFEITQIYTNDQSLGKNIDFLIPKNIAKSHQSLLHDFLKQDRINLNVFTKPQAICQDKDGWAIPYEIKFQISFVNQTLETGLACWLKRIKDERFHVLADLNKQISVITLSQQLYRQIFSERFTVSNLKKVNLSEWIPLLCGWQQILQSKQKKQIIQSVNKLEDNNYFNMFEQQDSYQRFQFDTILIKPQKGVDHTQINQETLVEDLIDLDLFRVNIELNFIQNKQMDYLHLTFNILEPFEDERQKYEHILEFKQLCQELNIQFEKYEESNENGSSKSPSKSTINRKKQKMKSIFFDQIISRDVNNLEKAEEQGSLVNNILSETQINTTRQLLSNRNQYYMGQENSSQTNLSQINYTHIQLGKYDEFQTNQKQNNVDGTLSQLVSTNLQLNKIDKLNTFSTANNFYDEVESPIKHYVDLENRQQNYSILNNLAKQDSINQYKIGNFQKFAPENNQIVDNNYNPQINNQIMSDLKVSNDIAEQQIQSDFNSDSISGTKQQTVNRQASISGVSSTNSERQIIARFISKKSGLAGIQIINLLGGVALFVMAMYSLIMFIQTNQILGVDKQNFLLINWMSGINQVLSISDTNLAALELIRLNFFNFNQDQEKQNIVKNLQSELIQQHQNLVDKMYIMYDKQSQDQIVFQNIVGNSLQLILYQGTDEGVFEVNCSLVYNIITQTGYIALQNHLLDSKKIFQHNMELNFQPLNSFIFNVTNKINHSFQERQSNQKTYLVQRISIFAIISFIFAISIIPTYSFVIKKQSDILKLFSTIEPEKINIMVQNLKYSKRIISISNQRQQLLKFNKMLSFNSFKSFEQNQLLVKKKNISNTIALQTQYGKVTAIVMIFFIFLQIQPVVDYFTSTEFFQNCQDRYTSFMAVMDMQSIMNEQVQGRYNILLSRLYPQNAVLDVEYYSEFLSNRDQWTSENLKRFQDLQNTKSQNSQYQTSKMTNIYYKSIEVNACDTFKANPQYFLNDQFDYLLCSQTNRGVLLQGLQIALKSFVQICSSFYQIQKISDNNEFQKQVMQFYQAYSLTDTIIFKQQLNQSLDYLLNFLKSINSNQYDDQINRQKVFIAWQLTTIFVTFFFGMIKYSDYIKKKIQQTKEYLNLIEIEVIENNPYLLSYLKKIS